MIKNNLPVLILKNIILFPHTEIRLEIAQTEEKKVVSVSESYYENNILVITVDDEFDNEFETEKLPKIGTLGKIKLKMDMPNGKTRLVIEGIARNRVHAYNKEDNIYDSMVSNIQTEEINSVDEDAYIKTLIKETENYIMSNESIDNVIINQIKNITSLSKLTDIISVILPFNTSIKMKYLNELDEIERCKILLNDISHDKEVMKLEKEIDDKLSHQLDESQKEYVLREKLKAIKTELGYISNIDDEYEELKTKIDNLKCNYRVKERLREELNKYSYLTPNSPEFGNVRAYIDWLLKLPWEVSTKDVDDLNLIQKRLDESHYGLNDVKKRIIEYIAVKKFTHNVNTPIICFVGPPGVGKTTLAKSIAYSLNRRCVKISVGGINDEAEIVGHRKAYIGSNPGRIINGIKNAKVNNPVFIIDEIDKMTKDIKGDPASSLLEVLDKEQNKKFIDHYLDIEFDLSKVLFILTANYIEQIPDELIDRLEIIELSSYTEYEKLNIAKSHLIKKLLKEHGLSNKKITFTDSALLLIIQSYTKEAGVRELERLISSILRKIIIEFSSNEINEYTINDDNVKKHLGNPKYIHTDNIKTNPYGVVNALSYAPCGGDLLKIESIKYSGNGELIITGSIGDVMEESAKIALSYIKNNCKTFNLNLSDFNKTNIHIHVPFGSVKKEGPSAGVAIITSLLSLFKGEMISNDITMTGEVTLTGNILPVGGLNEKIIAAKKNSIKTIFIPKGNVSDVEKLSEEIIHGIEFVYVDNYLDIYNAIFKGDYKLYD